MPCAALQPTSKPSRPHADLHYNSVWGRLAGLSTVPPLFNCFNDALLLQSQLDAAGLALVLDAVGVELRGNQEDPVG